MYALQFTEYGGPEVNDEIDALAVELRTLERAAKVAEDLSADIVAAAIRALASTPPQPEVQVSGDLVERLGRRYFHRFYPLPYPHMGFEELRESGPAVGARPDKLSHEAKATIEHLTAQAAALDWFAEQQRLELSYCSPTYGDDDDPEEWQVHRRGGSINDREWDLVGAGDTPLAAILAARQAIPNEGEGK